MEKVDLAFNPSWPYFSMEEMEKAPGKLLTTWLKGHKSYEALQPLEYLDRRNLKRGIVEHKDIANIQWNWKIVLLFLAFALCMFGLYSFMPVVIRVTSATSVNLGILTADLYSLFFGLFLFGYKFSLLYLLSFVVIMVGFILYCSTPTRSAEADSTSLPLTASTGFDNLAMKIEENHLDAAAVSPARHNKEESGAGEMLATELTAL
ncbi:UNVERIFIED_CONTAM: hypothetical protein K2H54_066935 [Gekko kuhli]